MHLIPSIPKAREAVSNAFATIGAVYRAVVLTAFAGFIAHQTGGPVMSMGIMFGAIILLRSAPPSAGRTAGIVCAVIALALALIDPALAEEGPSHFEEPALWPALGVSVGTMALVYVGARLFESDPGNRPMLYAALGIIPACTVIACWMQGKDPMSIAIANLAFGAALLWLVAPIALLIQHRRKRRASPEPV